MNSQVIEYNTSTEYSMSTVDRFNNFFSNALGNFSPARASHNRTWVEKVGRIHILEKLSSDTMTEGAPSEEIDLGRAASQVLNQEMNNLFMQLANEHIEEFAIHPAEDTLTAWLSGDLRWDAQNYLAHEFEAAHLPPAARAAMLRLIGRISKDLTKWAIPIAAQSLKDADVEVRLSAVRCFEEWLPSSHADALRAAIRDESEDWLREYMVDVLADLS